MALPPRAGPNNSLTHFEHQLPRLGETGLLRVNPLTHQSAPFHCAFYLSGLLQRLINLESFITSC